MVGSDDGQTFARPCLTLRGKHGTEVGHVAALHADEATAFHAEANLIVGKGAEVAILVEHLNGDMGSRIQLASANIRNLFIKALSWC